MSALPATPDDIDLLRFATAGSVDDGKSTLIGRLLYESGTVFDDQLEEIERASRRTGADYLDLALLTDGLRAEREQGITVDVAYRYFATPRRKFIVADTPGHVQYTRNMVTGMSTASLALVLLDAFRGVTEQSRRHIFIAAQLRVPHLVLCINKMDMVGYAQDVYERVCSEFAPFCGRLGVPEVTFVPISALKGDNVVSRSTNMPWYTGPALLEHLETVPITADNNLVDVRFPVQWVVRPISSDAHHDYRGFAGQVAGGILKPGDAVVALPSGLTSRIASVDTFDGPIAQAMPPQSVSIRLEDDLDVSRGDMLCGIESRPTVGQDIEAVVCWMSGTPLRSGGRYAIKHTTRSARAVVRQLNYRIDINTLEHEVGIESLGLNDIGAVTLRTTVPLFYDPYERNRTTGSFVLIDEGTNETVGAGMILPPS